MIQNNIFSWILSLFLGICITLVLFIFMNSMIHSNNEAVTDSQIYKVIDFIQVTKQNTIPDVKKELPPEPKPPKAPPRLPSEAQENSQTNRPINAHTLNLEIPNIGNGLSLGKGAPKLLAPIKMAKMDSVLTPIVQIKPHYPSRAKRMGTEGFVTVEVDVDKTGHVSQIIIVHSQPQGVFDKAVKKALRRWKFRPKSIDGKAVSQKGVLTLNFNLGK